jgi:two-component system, chemotaxis family, chemotaxis protein CheY
LLPDETEALAFPTDGECTVASFGHDRGRDGIDAAGVGRDAGVRETGMAEVCETKVAGIHILVVDDDLYARHAMMEGLRSRGYHVKGAEDGLQALHHLQRERFNLVITDIQMPRMDGVALLREICRHDYAPVIVQTTLIDSYLQDVLRRAGAAGVLMKGESVAELVRLVKQICQPTEESSPQRE